MRHLPSSSQLSPRRYGTELVISLLAVLGVTAGWYRVVQESGVPQPGSLVGHTLGIVGFGLMLCTEVLYSIRKRWATTSKWPTRTWLQVHICTGIVGAYLVLLHSAGKFNGLAGVVMLLTGITVASGFIGRYIYTAVPRTVDGVPAGAELADDLADADAELRSLGVNTDTTQLLSTVLPPTQPGWMLVLARPWLRRRQQQRLRLAMAQLRETSMGSTVSLEKLLERRCDLQLQYESLAVTRRLLALWHFFHVPLGVVLFTLAFIHIVAALHYATFLK